jgi:hypothetical protein
LEERQRESRQQHQDGVTDWGESGKIYLNVDRFCPKYLQV